MGNKVGIENYYHTGEWASYSMLESANKLRLLAEKDSKQTPFPFLVPSILLSFAAIETRMNEAIHDKIGEAESNIDPIVKNFVKEYRENISMSINHKILYFTKFLTGQTFDTESSLWGRFRNLQGLRNTLMHYKLVEVKEEELEKMVKSLGTGNWKQIFFKDLIHKKITVDTAKEAVVTAKDVMNKLNLYYFGQSQDYYEGVKI